MRVYDCFTFFNELDLLEFRLRLLEDYVDYFIIAESNLTHAGHPKEYFYDRNKERFAKWHHKIIHLPVTQTTEGLSFNQNETSYNVENGSWKLENEHRNTLHRIADRLNADDLVILSDLDEIPDPLVLKTIKLQDGPVVLSMLFHYYYMNCQHTGISRWWKGSIVCSGEYFRQNTPQSLRDKRNEFLKSIENAGWHFSYLGGVEKIKYKLKSFAHTEFNKPEYLDERNITLAIKSGTDILKRKDTLFRLVPVYKYPQRLRKLMKLYPAFLSLVPLKTKIKELLRPYNNHT